MASEISRRPPPPGDEFVKDIDQLVLRTLQNFGYSVDLGSRLRDRNFDEIVQMVLFCLKILFPEKELPSSIPYGMQNRFVFSNQLADAVKELNYSAEIGYHIFMYSNKEAIRNVLIFLTDQLPIQDNSSTFSEKDTARKFNVKQKVIKELQYILSKKNDDHQPVITTAPFISFPLETGILLPAQKMDCKPIEWKEFVSTKLPYIDKQLSDNRCFLPSVISLNIVGLHSPKRMKKTKISFNPLGDDFFKLFLGNSTAACCNIPQSFSLIQEKVSQSANVDGQVEDFTELSETEMTVLEIEKEVKEIEPQIEKMSAQLKQAQQTTKQLQRKVEEKVSQQSSLEHSISLLPNSAANVEKLETFIQKIREKIAVFESQTNDHRELLRQKLHRLQTMNEEKLIKRNQVAEHFSQIRSEIFYTAEQINQRNIILERLENRAKNVQGEKRHVHVERIFKFIENLNKQEREIMKILNDMRTIQKEINIESEKVDRCFTITSKLIKDQFPLDSFSIKAHQLLLTVHKLIEDIIQLDTEKVNQEKEVAQLENELLNYDTPALDALDVIHQDIDVLENEIKKIQNEIGTKKLELANLKKNHKDYLPAWDISAII